jgi:hypothetical protein
MVDGYTAHELARAAGFVIRRVPTGGVVAREPACGGRILELGPDATEIEIVRHACRFLVFPASTRPGCMTPDMTLAPAI